MTNTKDQVSNSAAILPKNLQSSVRLLSATKKLKESTIEKFDKDISEIELNIFRKLREIARMAGFVSDWVVYDNNAYKATFVMYNKQESSQLAREHAEKIGHDFFLCIEGSGKYIPLDKAKPVKVGDVFGSKLVTKIVGNDIVVSETIRGDRLW
jgi:hypothetical protein